VALYGKRNNGISFRREVLRRKKNRRLEMK
jgi:hypothetical protein